MTEALAYCSCVWRCIVSTSPTATSPFDGTNHDLDIRTAAWQQSAHGLSSSKTAPITSDCDAMHSSGIKWP